MQKQGSSEVSQVLPELLTGPVDVRLDGSQRELHDLGDLVVRIVLDVAQDDAGAILGAKLGDRGFDLGAELTRLQFFKR